MIRFSSESECLLFPLPIPTAISPRLQSNTFGQQDDWSSERRGGSPSRLGARVPNGAIIRSASKARI
jgi:hypothetical protein